MFVIDGKNIDTTTLSLRSNEKKEKGKQNWVLYLFQHGQMSLYCLSYTNQDVQLPKLSKESHNKKKTQDEDQNNNRRIRKLERKEKLLV